MPLYSHSRLSTYETCPLQYKLKYIDKIEVEEEGGIEAFLGSRVHDTLERLYKDLRYSKLLTLDELVTFYNAQWDKNWNNAVVIRKKELSAQNYKDTGVKCIKNYYSKYAPFNQGVTMGIEELISFSLSEDSGYKIRGYIDRLDRTKDNIYEIHDYKTSGSLPLQKDRDNDRQLALYEIGIREKYPDVKEVKLIWHYLVFDTEIASQRTPAQLEDLRKGTIALIDRIEADTEFKHKESNLCDWCDYWAYCPAKKHLSKVDALPPEEFLSDDGVTLVNKYTTIWHKLKELEMEEEKIKKAIAAYARKEDVGSIIGSDYIVKVRFEENLKFPKTKTDDRAELEKLIKALGLWDKMSQLNTKALANAVKFGKLDEELAEKIQQFASVEESIKVNPPKMLREEE